MTLPKFIITMDGYFRLGMVNQHKHLLKPGDQCIGGGYYHFDYTSNRIILDHRRYLVTERYKVCDNKNAADSHEGLSAANDEGERVYLMVIQTGSPLSLASTIFCFRR